MTMKKFGLLAAVLVGVTVMTTSAWAARVPDEGAFCMEREDGVCLRVCPFGPQECKRILRQKRKMRKSAER
jgi:hypothetical protein